MLNPSNAFESEFLEIEKFKSIKDYFKNLSDVDKDKYAKNFLWAFEYENNDYSKIKDYLDNSKEFKNNFYDMIFFCKDDYHYKIFILKYSDDINLLINEISVLNNMENQNNKYLFYLHLVSNENISQETINKYFIDKDFKNFAELSDDNKTSIILKLFRNKNIEELPDNELIRNYDFEKENINVDLFYSSDETNLERINLFQSYFRNKITNSLLDTTIKSNNGIYEYSIYKMFIKEDVREYIYANFPNFNKDLIIRDSKFYSNKADVEVFNNIFDYIFKQNDYIFSSEKYNNESYHILLEHIVQLNPIINTELIQKLKIKDYYKILFDYASNEEQECSMLNSILNTKYDISKHVINEVINAINFFIIDDTYESKYKNLLYEKIFDGKEKLLNLQNEYIELNNKKGVEIINNILNSFNIEKKEKNISSYKVNKKRY